MHKFKFEPPRDPRRSLQPPPRHDHVSIITTLDKCTQILREDRLWLRNEIKSNNSEILSIFKTYPKATQLQHLQIKLRKYLQGVKNRIKQEQLAKFRETLQHQTQLNNIYTQPTRKQHQNKSANIDNKFQLEERGWKRYEERGLIGSHSRDHLKSDSSCELSKTAHFRPNKSVQHKQTSQMVISNSLRHFQELLKYKCSNEVIEERESQNVTSARLARQEDNSKPLQELSYSSQLNQYNWKQVGKEIEKGKIGSWNFQKIAKKALYEEQEDSKLSHNEEIEEEMEQSIMDKHFVDDSQKASPRLLSTLQKDDLKSHTFSNQNYQEQSSFNFNSSIVSHSTNIVSSSFGTTSKLPESRADSDRNEQNIFTPLELLNECRNFLKTREHSTKKDMELKEKDNQEETGQCLFTRNNYKEAQLSDSMRENKQSEKKNEEKPVESKQEVPTIQKESEEEEEEDVNSIEKEENSFSYPEVKNAEEKPETFCSPKVEQVLYPQFQTFANSTLKSPFQKALSPPQIFKPQPSIPKNFSIQDFLEQVMEETQMSPFISIEQFSIFVVSNIQRQILTHVFSEVLAKKNGEDLCITGLAEQLNEAYNKANGKYPRNDSVINGVYDLLDMDQKGYIAREDVDSFLTQIEEAEVVNFQEVSEEVIRLFQGSDFNNEQRITYWHFYLVKNSDEFESVRQLLSEFQFEIERE